MSEAELKERIAKIIDNASMADMVDGRLGSNLYVDQILALLPQYEPVQLEGLTDKEIRPIFAEYLEPTKYGTTPTILLPLAIAISKATIAKNSKEQLYRIKEVVCSF